MTLRECIKRAQADKKAIGHFNASTLDGIWAIADAAKEMNVPVIVGLSEGERDYIGVREAALIIKSIKEGRGQEIFLNADHTYSFDRVKEAIDAGFDAAIFDGAKLPMEENIATAKKCVEYAKKSGREVLIEGELGFIGQSSKVIDAIPDGAAVKDEQMTQSRDAVRFVSETGVDLLAPAIGNIHGVVRGGDPALNIRRAREISESVSTPLVLHGSSGNSMTDVLNAIQAGIAIVHVSTELRLAYRAGLVKSLSEDPEEVAPYKYLKPAKLAMKKIVMDKLKVYN